MLRNVGIRWGCWNGISGVFQLVYELYVRAEQRLELYASTERSRELRPGKGGETWTVWFFVWL